ncbi:MAG: Stp1/IreP family PP2C-type Ser/Thr phosphatase [Gemmatimonadaceae bacterium]|nr:Stp1/IreP family PP2C-type Ser/Thr phosphatase [Gemmatimonadaceae bacterium]
MNVSPATPVIVQLFGRTDVGHTREHNEDTFLIADLERGDQLAARQLHAIAPGSHGLLLMVADGMGGAAAGEVASAMAAQVVFTELQATWALTPSTEPRHLARALRGATEAANARIHRYATEHPEHLGMGTTATVAGLMGTEVIIAQVGDSRAYMVRDGRATLLTKDQSLIQRLVDAGELTEEEAERSERRNIILQALGPEPTVKVELTRQSVRRGDVLLLCSDGLSGLVRGEEMAEIVRTSDTIEQVCDTLIDLANARGGPDNITVVAVHIDGSALPPPDPAEQPRYGVLLLGDEAVEPDTREYQHDGFITTPIATLVPEEVRQAAAARAAQRAQAASAPPLPVAELTTRREISRGYRLLLGAAAIGLGLWLLWGMLTSRS